MHSIIRIHHCPGLAFIVASCSRIYLQRHIFLQVLMDMGIGAVLGAA